MYRCDGCSEEERAGRHLTRGLACDRGVRSDVAEYVMMNACEENVISDVLQVDDRVPPPFTLFSNQTVVNLS